MKKLTSLFLVLLISISLMGCTNPDVSKIDDVQMLAIYDLAVNAEATELSYEEWLESITGLDGLDGREINLRVSEAYIQWQYTDDLDWQNLIALEDLTGANGKEVLFQVTEGYIQWRYNGDPSWTNLIELSMLMGSNGKEVLFQVSDDYIQWQYVGDSTWTNLIELSSLAGSDGLEVSFQIADGFIQWQYVGDDTWTNLIELSTLVGAAGIDGINGLNGTNGIEGKSAYEIYLEYNPEYLGDEDQWIQDLVNGNLSEETPITYLITFDSKGGDDISAQSVEFGEKVMIPENPIKEGYSFIGWFYEDTLFNWNFIGFGVTENMTLKAKWDFNEVFILDGDIETTIEFGSEYIEISGRIFLESGDYNLETNGEVNNLIIGDYIVTYYYQDSENYYSINRIIHVVDTVSPTFHIDNQIIHTNNPDIDWSTYIVWASDNYSIVLSYYEVEDNVDYDNPGVYSVIVKVVDESLNETYKTIFITVVNTTYPTGFYDYKFANTELRHTFMAAAESYLLNNMYAGVPLFANGGFALYSGRLQLPVSEFVPVMGFGTDFATMSADDSTVLMDDGLAGNVGEYTYRSTIYANPTTLLHWVYDDAVSSTVIERFSDALYIYEFNDDKTGYVVVPSMAASNPIPIDYTVNQFGTLLSKTWQIPLRDDLVWAFNSATVTTGYDMTIDANDFVETYELALTEHWFRAISGGGDFLSETSQIVNAQEFVNGEATWAEVGINKVDDLTIEFIFVNDMSEWDIREWLSSFVMNPIQMDLYDDLTTGTDGESVTTYGTTPETTAYTGAFILDYYEQDKILRYVENPDFHDPDAYFYTHYTYSVIEDADIRFNEFIAGKIETVTLPTTKYEEYKTHPGLKRIPGATTFRMMINGLGTVEAQQEQFEGSTWVPEPLLANQDFKMAMFFAIDRQKLAEEVLKTSTTNMFLFSDAYLVDAELGVPYRSTDEGVGVGEGLSPSTHGFNFDASVAYYKLAINALVADGTYTAGTASSPLEIELAFHIFSGSESQELMGAYIKTAFEEAFQDDVNHVNIIINVIAKDFPGIYYNYMMTGDFDLSIGGISGSQLDAASFLDTYSSDNRSGFTLNWGIDTSKADIEVIYYDLNNVLHREMWSFDAIASVLVGEVYVSSGAEAEVPAAKDFTYTPTTFTFTIDQFDSADFQDITYTVQTYTVADGYVDVIGWVDVVPTTATNTVTGVIPAFDDYPDTYLGDYQVVVSYAYTSDTEKTGTAVSAWWMQPSLLATSEVTTVDATSATISVTVNEDDYVRVLSEIIVYDYSDYSVVAATVDSTDLTAITITGLTADVTYAVVFVFDDDYKDYVIVVTPAS